MCSRPSLFTVPISTSLPKPLVTGMDSPASSKEPIIQINERLSESPISNSHMVSPPPPVIMASSTADLPRTTTPSVGTADPGSTRRMSPTWMSSVAISSILRTAPEKWSGDPGEGGGGNQKGQDNRKNRLLKDRREDGDHGRTRGRVKGQQRRGLGRETHEGGDDVGGLALGVCLHALAWWISKT